jgi:hypothetical protein
MVITPYIGCIVMGSSPILTTKIKDKNMNKEQVLELLKVLQNNDCLHPEWEWYEEDENENLTINEDSLWVIDAINQIINK